MKRSTLSIAVAIAVIFCWQHAYSQIIKCGSAERHRELLQQHPELAVKQQQLEQLYQHYSVSPKKAQRALITIPVIVHVVHDGDTVGGDENITDAQIFSQIEALNIDYRKQNPDTSNIPSVFLPLAADFELEFCLATRDPDDHPTTGIERINGQRNLWTITTADEFKPSTIWNPSKYLNIWVMRLGGTSAGTLGYAQFPGMPDSTDGIVVDYKAFGTIGFLHPDHEEGKTLTHEVGHWLGLRHVWGDESGCSQDDQVSDTPVQGAENYGCPTFPHVSCNNAPNGDMFMNYMDYTNDNCSFMFTEGQKARADFFLNNQRDSITISNGCEPLPVYQRDMAILEIISPTEEFCSNTFVPVLRVKNFGTETITALLLNYQIDGGSLNQAAWQGWIDPGAEEYIFMDQQTMSPGAHSFYVYLSGLNGGLDQNVGNEEAQVNYNINSIGIGVPVPAQAEGFETPSLPSGWTLENPNNDRTWVVDTAAGVNGSDACVMFDNFTSNPRGTRDGLITPQYDFRNLNVPYLTFSVAYARKNPVSKDSLILYYSIDCGDSWKRLWVKTNSALATTASDRPQKFVPALDEWREEHVSIHFLTEQSKVQFKFENYSDWGNNVYIDNFKIGQTPVGISHARDHGVQLNVFPNPSSGVVHVNITHSGADDLSLEVLDLTGKSVKQLSIGRMIQWSGIIDLSAISKGMYLLRVQGGNGAGYKKLVIE